MTDHSFLRLADVEGFRPFDGPHRRTSRSTMPEDRRSRPGDELHIGNNGQAERCASGAHSRRPFTGSRLYPDHRFSRDVRAARRKTTTFTSADHPSTTPPVLVFSSSARSTSGHAVVLMDKWLPEEMLRLIDTLQGHSQSHGADAVPPAAASPTRASAQQVRRVVAARDDPRRSTLPRRNEVEDARLVGQTRSTSTTRRPRAAARSSTPEEWRKHPGTVGKAWANADVKIYDDEENELPAQATVGTVYMLLGQANFEYKDAKKKTKRQSDR